VRRQLLAAAEKNPFNLIRIMPAEEIAMTVLQLRLYGMGKRIPAFLLPAQLERKQDVCREYY
jgi:hypothetical protein